MCKDNEELTDCLEDSDILESIDRMELREGKSKSLKILEEYMKESKYDNLVHMHLHTFYSFLDGFNKPWESAARAAELGMTAQAITDHNHLAGVIDFQKACHKEGVKPILGVELYYTWDTNILSMNVDDRDKIALEKAKEDGVEIKDKMTKKAINQLIGPYKYDTVQYHILFLAKNQNGWHNLVKLQSEAAEKCTFNGRYLCDDDMMKKYSEDLIMTTACISNAANRLFIQEKDEEAHKLLANWKEIFKDNFYIEIQPLSIKKQWVVNTKLVRWALDNDVKIIATNDVHYTNKDDHNDHDTLVAISTGKTKDDPTRMQYSNDFWIKSYDEMIESFAYQMEDMRKNEFHGKGLITEEEYAKVIVDALDETNILAEEIEEVRIGSEELQFPKFNPPNGMSNESYLTHKCYQALYKYKSEKPEINLQVYEARLKEELDIINSKGFAPYMHIVEDYVKWANENDCPTGPGRGSGAGSLILFLLGITKIIDPIEHNLLFFRFLTEDRSSPPDCIEVA